jgi:hypothetical protein
LFNRKSKSSQDFLRIYKALKPGLGAFYLAGFFQSCWVGKRGEAKNQEPLFADETTNSEPVALSGTLLFDHPRGAHFHRNEEIIPVLAKGEALRVADETDKKPLPAFVGAG